MAGTPLVALLSLCSPLQQPELTHGPFLGHCTPTSAMVWARVSKAGEYTLELTRDGGEPVPSAGASASEEHDLTLRFTLEGLEPNSDYRFAIRHGELLLTEAAHVLRTTPRDDARRARIAFASCADERRFPEMPGWSRMIASGAEAIVTLGDMPYIDSVDLSVQRRRYREFYENEELRDAFRQVPFYSTWDDHDFGKNDTDGVLAGKENARRAFLEYHANPSYGVDGEGVFTRFRRGPVEVFLLDTRWFAGTELSFADPTERTLIGTKQWAWLKRSLRSSSAPFKVIASGMIWNGATRPGKTDHWENYPHEREALFRWLGTEGIPGVVLVGGDIHRSRALRYPTKEQLGYELTELITSPLANRVIESANAPSPHLLFDVGVTQTFLLLDVQMTETPNLTARFLEADGNVLYELEIERATLQR